MMKVISETSILHRYYIFQYASSPKNFCFTAVRRHHKDDKKRHLEKRFLTFFARAQIWWSPHSLGPPLRPSTKIKIANISKYFSDIVQSFRRDLEHELHIGDRRKKKLQVSFHLHAMQPRPKRSSRDLASRIFCAV